MNIIIIIIIIIGAIIPIVNALDFADLQTCIISSILGASVVIITGLTQLEKYQENWIIYRTTTEVEFLSSSQLYYYGKEERPNTGLADKSLLPAGAKLLCHKFSEYAIFAMGVSPYLPE